MSMNDELRGALNTEREACMDIAREHVCEFPGCDCCVAIVEEIRKRIEIVGPSASAETAQR